MGLLKNLFGKGKQLDGVSVAIINGNKILLLKRLPLPFIINPGIWTFVQGSRDNGETYAETAYREVLEETGMARGQLHLLEKPRMVSMFELRNPKRKWHNMLFIFEAKNPKVRINYESSGYRWASYSELELERTYSNIFADKSAVEAMLSKAMKKPKASKMKPQSF